MSVVVRLVHPPDVPYGSWRPLVRELYHREERETYAPHYTLNGECHHIRTQLLIQLIAWAVWCRSCDQVVMRLT